MTVEPTELRTEYAVSAGGVVYRRYEYGIDVVLCGRIIDGLWAIPKGTPAFGESLAETAVREVREETGLGVTIVDDLGSICYEFSRPAQGVRFDKTVHHFLMMPDGTGATDLHDQEYDRVEWFQADEAMHLLTHRNEQTVLRRAIEAIERGRAA